jgi:hypothetical protein
VSPSPRSICGSPHSSTAPENAAQFDSKQAAWRTGVASHVSRMFSNSQWNLNSALREDIHQAQLAPLMSALLGVPAPTNGMFVLPDRFLARDVSGMHRDAFPTQVRVTRLGLTALKKREI